MRGSSLCALWQQDVSRSNRLSGSERRPNRRGPGDWAGGAGWPQIGPLLCPCRFYNSCRRGAQRRNFWLRTWFSFLLRHFLRYLLAWFVVPCRSRARRVPCMRGSGITTTLLSKPARTVLGPRLHVGVRHLCPSQLCSLLASVLSFRSSFLTVRASVQTLFRAWSGRGQARAATAPHVWTQRIGRKRAAWNIRGEKGRHSSFESPLNSVASLVLGEEVR